VSTGLTLSSQHPGTRASVGVGVLGATGYVGAELVRLLGTHPGAALRALGSRRHAESRWADAWPGIPEVDLVLDDDLDDPGAWLDRGVEVVFSALPHGAFASRAQRFLEAGLRVVDLSADFRLRSAEEYLGRYGILHPAPQLLRSAAYGLPEWWAGDLEGAGLVANPGCYATAVLLAALPALEAGWWSGGAIVVSALSGVSGAGRAPTLTTHFAECGGSAAPYKVGEDHPHLGEIRQAMSRVTGGSAGTVVFNPHLVPMARGILANVALPLRRAVDRAEAEALYRRRYEGARFVRVREGDALPETRHVRGSNRCDAAVRVVDGGRLLLVFAAIDNLVKGAAGQAIQNWNLMQGWPEDLGLPLAAWTCA